MTTCVYVNIQRNMFCEPIEHIYNQNIFAMDLMQERRYDCCPVAKTAWHRKIKVVKWVSFGL